MREELLKGLTEEQIAKVKACKNTEEMLALAKEEGIELTDEQLEAISGGACNDDNYTVIRCPSCHSSNLNRTSAGHFECISCGNTFRLG